MALKRLALLILLGYAHASFGWGDEGHRITGYVANALLSPATRVSLRTLVGTDDLSRIATWMDDSRDALAQRIPDSSRWHYENREICPHDAAEAPCPRGACLTRQLRRLEWTIADPHQAKVQRAEAVRMVVHLLGDLHQPLHLADHDDRGGNDIWVRLPHERAPRRLHEVWDTRLVQLNVQRRNEAAYANALLTRFADQTASWRKGSVSTWAQDSFDLAQRTAYAPLPHFACGAPSPGHETAVDLPNAYLDAARPVVDEQLTKAGVRIAVELNRLLGTRS